MPDSSCKVIICLTTTGTLTTHVAASVAYAYGEILLRGIPSGLLLSDLVDVASARRALVGAALDTDATHLLWLDGDILINPSDALALIAQRDLRVVGGVYRKRSFPHEPVVCDYLPEEDGFTMKTNFNPETTQRVGGMGHGCLLVELDVYREMAKFYNDNLWYIYLPSLGEDLYFFKRLAHMGIPAYLDGRVRAAHQTTRVITVESEPWPSNILEEGTLYR